MNIDILRNELIWLKSIGCSIEHKKGGIEVKSAYTTSTDFNFFIPINGEKQETIECYRVSESMRDRIFWLKDMNIEKSYDINYTYFKEREKKINTNYRIMEVDFQIWKNNDEFQREKEKFAHYFIVFVGNIEIGRFSTIEENIVGIYDYEFEEKYRNKGFGSSVLNFICSKYDKMVFIQTWSENLAAKKCYEKAGFLEREKIYRYNCCTTLNQK